MSRSTIPVLTKYRISRHHSQGFLDIEGEKDQQKLDPPSSGFLYDASMEIKDWIKAARIHAEKTQEQLGDLLGITKGNVSAWEKGRHEASFAQLQRISELTGYPLQLDKPVVAQPASQDDLQALAEVVAIFTNGDARIRRRILESARSAQELYGSKASGVVGNKS